MYHADRAGSLFNIALRKQRSDCFLLFAPEFCCRVLTSDAICRHLQPGLASIAIPSPRPDFRTIRLLLSPTRVIHVVTAVINRRGESTMTTEEQETTQATATVKEPEAPKKARVAPRRAHVASSKAKSGKKPTSAKKGTKAPKKAKSAKAEGAREGSKTAKVLDLLKRPGGATMKETHESHRLAAALRARLPVWHDRQEDGAGRDLHQERRRRAQLLRQGLIATNWPRMRRRGSASAAFLCLGGKQ